ncbi:hypothetical protein [Sphaerisporangium corydalis]|uniref:CENP-V/GFA domain-containing protein n=1 Tax=Sphaerisporangium corydalis TaxID=1441875 RepID=A0ABV9ECE1_9ACTN|nr:hypothetical protein [Sphaerisporangium corydalis]
MIDQTQAPALDPALTEVHAHSYEHITTATGALTRVLCSDCGQTWSISPGAESVIGYVVVGPSPEPPAATPWMSPRMYLIDSARAERAFWQQARSFNGPVRLGVVTIVDDHPAT